jgi:hypothetical protein
MKRLQLVVALILASAVFIMPRLASAGDFATAAEADALLQRAIVEMKADATAALAKFNDPLGDFRDRDLYVFCADINSGLLTAHPSIVGTDLRTLKDKNGKAFGAAMLTEAREGAFTEISYLWPRPGGTDPVEKVSRVTRIGNQMCGVGYYK